MTCGDCKYHTAEINDNDFKIESYCKFNDIDIMVERNNSACKHFKEFVTVTGFMKKLASIDVDKYKKSNDMQRALKIISETANELLSREGLVMDYYP